MSGKLMVLGVKIGFKVGGLTRRWLYEDKECLNVVVTNLVGCRDATLLYSRQDEKVHKWKHNPKGLSNHRITRAIDWLEKEGYVINTVASKYQMNNDLKKMSYAFPTEKFLSKFSSHELKAEAAQSVIDAFPVLCFSGPKGTIPYKDTPTTLKYENEMRLMNASNAQHTVIDHEDNHVDTLYKRNFRIDITLNGRMYGMVTSMENKLSGGRLRMVSDGDAMVEVDYEAMHLNIFADMHGFALPHGDAYMNILPPPMQTTANRSVVKGCFTRLLNCASRRSALLSFREPMADVAGHTFNSPSHVLDCISEALSPLTQYLYAENLGLSLTNTESNIMTDVIQCFVALGKVILPVHDSAIVVREDGPLLAGMMADAYRKHMGVSRIVRMRSSILDGTLIKVDCSQ